MAFGCFWCDKIKTPFHHWKLAISSYSAWNWDQNWWCGSSSSSVAVWTLGWTWESSDQVEMKQRVIVRWKRCPLSGHLHNLYRVSSPSVGHVDEESEGRIWSQRVGRVHGELCNVIFPHLRSVFSRQVRASLDWSHRIRIKVLTGEPSQCPKTLTEKHRHVSWLYLSALRWIVGTKNLLHKALRQKHNT